MYPSFFVTRQVRTTKLGILGLFGIHPFGALAVPLGQGPEKPVVSVAHTSSQEMPLKDPITGLPLPSTLQQIAFIPTTNRQQYAVSADGQKFFMRGNVPTPSTTPIMLILNWKPN